MSVYEKLNLHRLHLPNNICQSKKIYQKEWNTVNENEMGETFFQSTYYGQMN